MLLALALTIAIEVPIAFALGYKRLAAIVLINVITNPAINWLYSLLSFFSLGGILTLVILEVIVILAEWKLLEYALAKKGRSILLLSVVINTVSFVVGMLLSYLSILPGV